MTDFGKVAFTSKYRYERVSQKSHVDFTVPGSFGTATATITHDLGYRPMFKGRYTFNDGKYYSLFAGTYSYNIAGNDIQLDNILITTNSIQITFTNFGASSASGKIYYRIYEEPIV